MTEPDVASSDATNMEATAVVDGDEVVINGRKWWSTGVGHPRLQDPRVHGRSPTPTPTATTATRWCSSRATPRA